MYSHSEIKNYKTKTNRGQEMNNTRKKMDYLFQDIQNLND